MSALRIAQAELGWLSRDTIEFVANYLAMPAIAAYEVATFYNMYDLQPVGRNKVTCAPTCRASCRERTRSGNTCRPARHRLRRDHGRRRYTLKEGECMGACGMAPVPAQQPQDARSPDPGICGQTPG